MIRGIRKVAALAHQLAAQVRVRRKAVAAVQPEQVVNEQKFAHRHRYGKDVLLVSSASEAAQPCLLRNLSAGRTGRYSALPGGPANRRRTPGGKHLLTFLLGGAAHWAASQRVAEKFVEMLPVVEMQQQGIAALHVLLVDLHH